MKNSALDFEPAQRGKFFSICFEQLVEFLRPANVQNNVSRNRDQTLLFNKFLFSKYQFKPIRIFYEFQAF